MIILAFIFGVIITLFILIVYIVNTAPKTYITKNTQPKNNVHFYVSKDKNGFLALWLGKPLRAKNQWINDVKISVFITYEHEFYRYSLSRKDYKDLKWEDEPKEVFVNLKD